MHPVYPWGVPRPTGDRQTAGFQPRWQGLRVLRRGRLFSPRRARPTRQERLKIAGPDAIARTPAEQRGRMRPERNHPRSVSGCTCKISAAWATVNHWSETIAPLPWHALRAPASIVHPYAGDRQRYSQYT